MICTMSSGALEAQRARMGGGEAANFGSETRPGISGWSEIPGGEGLSRDPPCGPPALCQTLAHRRL